MEKENSEGMDIESFKYGLEELEKAVRGLGNYKKVEERIKKSGAKTQNKR